MRESDVGCGAKQAGRVRWLASGRERAVAAWWSGPGKETREQAGLWCGPCGEKDRAARGLIWATGLDAGLLCPAGWVLGFAFSISTPLYLFLIQTKVEFKYKFEFKPHSNI